MVSINKLMIMKSICSKYAIEEVNQEKWSYYWSKVSHHNLVQSWEYGEAKNTADTWIPIRFLVRDNKDNPVAILQVLTKTWPLIGGIARLNRGPLLIKNNEVTIELEYKIKIFAKGFSQSKAYFNPNPLSVCLSGAREWAPMYPLIRSISLLEALNDYRKNGLQYIKYWKYRNIALSNFIPDLVYMAVHKNQSGYKYIKPLNLILSNCLYPRFYWSFFKLFDRLLLNCKNWFAQ